MKIDNKQSADEEIRQVFEANLISIRTKLKDILRDNFYDTRFNPTPANVRIEHLIADMIETGFKARDISAQAEIEEYKKKYEKRDQDARRFIDQIVILKQKKSNYKHWYEHAKYKADELEKKIEELKDEFKRVDSEKDDLLIELSKRDSRIKELEQEAKDAAEAYSDALDNIHKELECCGNCGYYNDGQSGLNCIDHFNGSDHCDNWKQRRSHE